MKQFVCLSGLPRSGSTILSAILDQNPLIHAEGNSAVCQFMWDIHQAGTVHALEQLKGNNRIGTIKDIIQQVPQIYYKDIPVGKKIIVDKCRSWTIASNVEILRTNIDPHIKIIVLERPIIEIVKSFVSLRKENNWEDDLERELLDEGSEPIVRSFHGVKWAKENNDNNTFLFIQYNDLINNTKETINKIYSFIDEPVFEHDLNNIINKHPEDDKVYNMIGQHDIRPTINERQINIELSQETIDKCQKLEQLPL